MTNLEIAERIHLQIVQRIEDLVASQPSDGELLDSLDKLQVELIGQESLDKLRAERFKAYQDAHPWLYPEIYGPVQRPAGGQQLITPKQFAEICLQALKGSLAGGRP